MAQENIENNKSALLEWCTAIFAIFWGVWWTKISEIVFSGDYPIIIGKNLILPVELTAVIMALYVALFTYIYINWMWRLRKLSLRSSFGKAIKTYLPILIVVSGLIIAYKAFYNQGFIEYHQFLYGELLTISWIVITSLIILKSARWNY